MSDHAKWFDANRDKWGWARGMVNLDGNAILSVSTNNDLITYFDAQLHWEYHLRKSIDDFGVPDITDPATQGCLEAQARERKPGMFISCWQDGSESYLYYLYEEPGFEQGQYETREDAIIAALGAG